MHGEPELPRLDTQVALTPSMLQSIPARIAVATEVCGARAYARLGLALVRCGFPMTSQIQRQKAGPRLERLGLDSAQNLEGGVIQLQLGLQLYSLDDVHKALVHAHIASGTFLSIPSS